MAAQFRTAFMGPSGFSTATAAVAKPAFPAKSDRKVAAKARVTAGRPARETKVTARKTIEAA